MVMSGLLAKQIVQILEKSGIQSVSLTGVDGMLLKAQRKKKLIVLDERGRKVAIEGGFTGKISTVNTELLDMLLSNGIVPVISPVAVGEEFELLNIDGDRACSHIAGALKAETAIFLTDTEGLILDDIVVQKMKIEEARKALPRIGAGMDKKVIAAVEAVEMGAARFCDRIRAEGSSSAECRIRSWDGYFKLKIEDNHLVPLYQKFPIEVVRGEGALVYDSSGREYIDLSGGYGVAIVGHSNPRVADAISKQAMTLITCHGSLYNDSRERYLSLLSKHLPRGLSRVFFSNSGAEANEAGLKFARKATGRQNIVAFTGELPRQDIRRVVCNLESEVQKAVRASGPGSSFLAVRQFGESEGGNRRNCRRCTCGANPGRKRYPCATRRFPVRFERGYESQGCSLDVRRGTGRLWTDRQTLGLRELGRHSGHPDSVKRNRGRFSVCDDALQTRRCLP